MTTKRISSFYNDAKVGAVKCSNRVTSVIENNELDRLISVMLLSKIIGAREDGRFNQKSLV